MATRNLTKLFIDYRSSAKANRSLRGREDDDTDDGLLEKSAETTNWQAVRNTLPPVWVDKIENINANIQSIQIMIKELNNLHTKRLMVNFETDERLQEREIDAKTQQITRLFKDSEVLLNRFSHQGDENKVSDAELKTRNGIQQAIARKLQALTGSFRQSQKEYMNKLQSQKKGGGSEAFGFLDEPRAAAETGAIVDYGMTSQQIQQVDDMSEIVNQRDDEIVRIAKSVEELAAIFKELAVLVIDQGTILDRIDFNLEKAGEHAKEGVANLVKAEEHQKNALPFRCIVVLVILIAIMLGILIWKHSGNKK